MESDLRFYQRRAAEERMGAMRAITVAARERRLMLAEQFQRRVAELSAELAAA